MISLPPNDDVLHAYVDRQLDDDDHQRVQQWLSNHPQASATVAAWQEQARQLRAALGQGAQQPANPALDPQAIRRRLRARRQRRLASAAVLVLAVGVGALSGWQARELTLARQLPMTDALQAYRLFAEQSAVPADLKVSDSRELQPWLDRYFSGANPLPDLQSAGFTAVSARLMSTEQGPAAMVLYQDGQGRRVTFYIRPPGGNNLLLPRGSRRDGELQAEYWSSAHYNYAMVSPVDNPALPLLQALPSI
ncbi:anti-sigma factor [Pseudomonas sp. HR96]|uniref:anti-sigma factor family protein n=1 Tax=Pseudomonas sp. HR96 TaxID=1027966 RepID=UPI002A760E95|nr:anti-sigma factor [Pseudomonas sp. HR96]WPP01489.1 anti-sigma factor [Pseudomonas sp. HR96]